MIYEYKGIRPTLGEGVFLAPGVIVLGDVHIGDHSNLWFHTVVRGDVNRIRIGTQSNIQDQCMLHVTSDLHPLNVGNSVVVGHRAVLHGCTVCDNVLIGIASVVLDGAVVEEGAVVAAGAVVVPGTVIPSERVAMGIPARPARRTSDEERALHKMYLDKYQQYGRDFHHLVHPV